MIALKSLKHKTAKMVRKGIISKPARHHFGDAQDGPIVVAGLFSTGSGIGQSARACYRGLKRAGVDCLALDLSPKFDQVDLPSDIPTIKSLPAAKEGTIILHLNGPETQHGLYHARLLFGRNWRVIGYWAWELQQPPRSWARESCFLSEIWTPSEFVKRSIAPIVDVPIRVVPHYISPPHALENKTQEPSQTTGLNFLTMADGFSSFHRKNLYGAVEAYASAFTEQDEHHLTVKCRNLDKYPNMWASLKQRVEERSDITIIDQTLHEQDMWTLLHTSDVVVSLHRAEGFGLHLAEAMSLGKVVVGTNWSGNLSFMTPDNSILIPSELVELQDPTGIYSDFEGAVWAEASVEFASMKLRELSEDDALRRTLGAQAQRDITAKLSPLRYVEALKNAPTQLFEDVLPAFAE